MVSQGILFDDQFGIRRQRASVIHWKQDSQIYAWKVLWITEWNYYYTQRGLHSKLRFYTIKQTRLSTWILIHSVPVIIISYWQTHSSGCLKMGFIGDFKKIHSILYRVQYPFSGKRATSSKCRQACWCQLWERNCLRECLLKRCFSDMMTNFPCFRGKWVAKEALSLLVY